MTSHSGITTAAGLQQRITFLARQLEIAEPTLADIRQYGHRHRMNTAVARLDALE
jgi:hypothetical protein